MCVFPQPLLPVTASVQTYFVHYASVYDIGPIKGCHSWTDAGLFFSVRQATLTRRKTLAYERCT